MLRIFGIHQYYRKGMFCLKRDRSEEKRKGEDDLLDK